MQQGRNSSVFLGVRNCAKVDHIACGSHGQDYRGSLWAGCLQELCEKTLGKKKERKGHRYTEEFKSSQEGVKSFSDHSLKFMSVQQLGFMTTLAQPGGILALSNKWA